MTGHKSVQFLYTYQRVGNDEKLLMGLSISNIMNNADPVEHKSEIVPALPSPETAASEVQKTVVAPNLSPRSSVDHFEGIDLNDIFSEFSTNTTANACSNTCNTQTCDTRQAFYGNVTIIHNLTINKK